jgi:hypothetical protein
MIALRTPSEMPVPPGNGDGGLGQTRIIPAIARARMEIVGTAALDSGISITTVNFFAQPLKYP